MTFFAHFMKLILGTVVVINEADTLSRDAQAALRRTMEKYMTNMRIILCANSTSKLIAPIRSRCLLIRVPAPSVEEVRPHFSLPKPICHVSWLRFAHYFRAPNVSSGLPYHRATAANARRQMQTVLKYVGQCEGFDVPDNTAELIAEDANGNMRKALLVLEALKMQKYVLASFLHILLSRARMSDREWQHGPLLELAEHCEA